jgi:hypothetical protein
VKNRIDILLKQQAEWQKSRAALSWSKKLRQSLILRKTGMALRKDYKIDDQIDAVAEVQAEYGEK